jgi:thiol-disulfide isomerase/thioredoxin
MRLLWAAVVTVQLCACSLAEPPGTGSVVDFPTLDQNWMIVNYWAEWCAPCREEIPELNRLAAHSSDVDVYAINFDGVQGELLRQQSTDMGIAFTQLARDPGAQLGIARPTVLPTTLILAPDGTLITRLIGPQTEDGLLHELALAREKHQSSVN